jgi:hypothetical protein
MSNLSSSPPVQTLRLVNVYHAAAHTVVRCGRLTLGVIWGTFWLRAEQRVHVGVAGGTLLVRLGPFIFVWQGKP